MKNADRPSERPVDLMRSGGLVPLYASDDSDRLFRLAELIVEAGIPVMEVTLRVPGALEALGRLIGRIEQEGLPLLAGAGTVLSGADTDRAVQAGAGFVFSPIVDPEVAARCRAAGVAWIPGCATPTEVHTAMAHGCSAVKLFPADAIGGPGFLRAVRAVLPAVEAIPSGGVSPDPDALEAWFRAGATAVAMGSRLFPPEAIAAGEWSEVKRRLDTAVSAVTVARERLKA